MVSPPCFFSINCKLFGLTLPVPPPPQFVFVSDNVIKYPKIQPFNPFTNAIVERKVNFLLLCFKHQTSKLTESLAQLYSKILLLFCIVLDIIFCFCTS